MIKLKPIKAAILTLDSGEQIHVEQIGKGRFSTAWKNGTAVYVQTHEKDYGKELLCHLSGKPHLPTIEALHSDSDTSCYNWYKMPLYRKLTAASTKAWADYKRLKGLLQEAHRIERATIHHSRDITPSCINDRFEEFVRSTPGLESYSDSVEELVSWCATYGSTWLIEELQPRNCAVDEAGELILLDPVFDLADLRKEQAARMNKARR